MTAGLSPDAELDYATNALPGGSLLASVYDRSFMQLSDRGGASNIIGDRWAALCADALARTEHIHSDSAPHVGPTGVLADTTVRLDDIPEIARIASRNNLQNPDFLMLAASAAGHLLWAADAKFSVDTARSKQVSGDVVRSLLGMGDTIRRLLPNLHPELGIHDGVFLCPDYALTHRLLRERRGPRRTTVGRQEVRLIAVSADEFLEPMGQDGLRTFFATLDGLPFDPHASLMLGLYYFRLGRAALGCWQDQTAPLLAYQDLPAVDDAAVEQQARTLATMKTTAWGLVQRWNDLADGVRRQRAAVDRATALPINGRQLREQVVAASSAARVVPPSGTRVRRAIGAWYRARIRDQFGPILPPVDEFESLVADLGRYSRSLHPEIAQVTRDVIDDMVLQAVPLELEPASPG